MRIGDLDALVRERESAGHQRMILAVRRRKAPGHAGALLPGVPCVYVGWENGRAVCDVAVADLRRYLDRHATQEAPDAAR